MGERVCYFSPSLPDLRIFKALQVYLHSPFSLFTCYHFLKLSGGGEISPGGGIVTWTFQILTALSAPRAPVASKGKRRWTQVIWSRWSLGEHKKTGKVGILSESALAYFFCWKWLHKLVVKVTEQGADSESQHYLDFILFPFYCVYDHCVCWWKTSQELRMLSSVTINSQVTKIVINPGSQFSVL